MKKDAIRKILAVLLTVFIVMLTGCEGTPRININFPDGTSGSLDLAAPGESADDPGINKADIGNKETKDTDDAVQDKQEKNGEVMILFTSDVHCGVDQGFGYAGLAKIREAMENKGYTTILVDDGDAFQGEAIGTLTKGEAIINIMNACGYDVAVPGNHDFDYGMEQFLHLTQMADFPYICCNFRKEGKPVFQPYIIKEACGIRIAFVGVCTPKTLTTSTPAYFQNEKGEYIYDFMQDATGEEVYKAVQDAVDAARADGADVVYVMGHMGNEDECKPWTYADIISHTNGIDAFLDGHSHDLDRITMPNKDGDEVRRVAVGYKFNCIGYSRVTKDEGIVETEGWIWDNKDPIADLFEVDASISAQVSSELAVVAEDMKKVVAKSEVDLTINDPVKKDDQNHPLRIVRSRETNLGDLCADAYRDQLGTDIGIINSGAVRDNISKGDVTYGDIINVHPFENNTCVIKATGQQILDALEWGARSAPGECGGLLQVSGMSYEIDTSIPSGCITDNEEKCAGINGERRVKNVLVDNKPIDPDKTYTIGSVNYVLRENGDGYTAFDDSELVDDNGKIDNQILIDYIVETLGGTVGDEYADPYGQGRITIK